VPLAYALSAHTLGLGLPGVWIAISITASIKGIWSYVWYMVDEAKRKAKENVDQGDGSVDLLK